MPSPTCQVPRRDVLTRLRAHAAHAESDMDLATVSARPLAGGRNNAVYEWTAPDGPMCIKIYRVDERRRIEREWMSLTLLAMHHVTSAPTPLWIDPDPDQPAMGMTLLPGQPLLEARDSRRALRALAQVLRRFSSLPLDGELSAMTRIDSLDHYVRRITEVWAPALADHPRDGLTRDLLRIVSQWQSGNDTAILAEPVSRIFSRGDSNLLNWLWDGTWIRCVDFEFAGWSDLAFDCADLTEHISARDIDDQVWTETVSAIGLQDDDWRRYAAAQRTCALRWLAVLWKQRDTRADEFSAQFDRVRALHAAAEASA
jgi:Ser/Thr protein kinase RdoA (MazF antagonist)